MLSQKEQKTRPIASGALDCRDPDVIGAYLSRKLPESHRNQVTRCLANDSEARELMAMSYQALKATARSKRSSNRDGGKG